MGLKRDIKDYLKSIHTVHRYKHILGVQKTSVKLAEIFYSKKEKVSKSKFIYNTSIAALLHDIDKGKDLDYLWKLIKKDKDIDSKLRLIIKDSKEVYHAFGGAYTAKIIFGAKDEDILNSIRYHTTGRKNMSTMEKIIYLADYIEPGRDIPGLDAIRKVAKNDLDKACLMTVEKVLRYLKGKDNICTLALDFKKDIKEKLKK